MLYYHGSNEYLKIGTVLKPKENYQQFWSETDFYAILEKYRPTHMLAHHQSVFFVIMHKMWIMQVVEQYGFSQLYQEHELKHMTYTGVLKFHWQ